MKLSEFKEKYKNIDQGDAIFTAHNQFIICYDTETKHVSIAYFGGTTHTGASAERILTRVLKGPYEVRKLKETGLCW